MDFSQIPSPCYVIDERLLRRNLEIISHVREAADVEIILALKGFAMWGAFPLMRADVQGVAASSEHEARLAFEEMGVEAHTYSPAYNEAAFDEVMRCSSHITFNSLNQYERFRDRLRQSGKNISMGLRVNPEFSQVATDLYNPCAPGSRLGVTEAQLNTSLPPYLEGLHVHALCESGAEATAKLLAAVENKFGRFFPQIKWLNLGGGHLMTSQNYDLELLINTLKDFRQRYPHIRLILEPGAAFVWETGVLRATVEDIVENDNIRTAILNVSFTAHMPDCLEMPYKPRIRGASEPRMGCSSWRIGGNSCLAGDYIGDWMFAEPLDRGMTIVFEDMIHYTMVKTTTFNGVQHPSIGIWNDERGFTLLKRFIYEDYKNRLS